MLGEYAYNLELEREAARESAIENKASDLLEDVTTLHQCVFADMPNELGAALAKFFADRAADARNKTPMHYEREIRGMLWDIHSHLRAEAEAVLEIESDAAECAAIESRIDD